MVVRLPPTLVSGFIEPLQRATFLQRINASFENVIVTASTEFGYITSEIPELREYKEYQLLRFGYLKRAELAEKWITLGREDTIVEADLYKELDDLTSKLDSLIRNNILPPNPINILIFLQLLESFDQQKLSLTSHGHCYQELIYRSLRSAGVSTAEMGKYINVLTELAWTLYKKGAGLFRAEMPSFYDEYEESFLRVNRDLITNTLVESAMLVVIDDRLQFKYPYVFYFFVAKKIAEGFSKSDEIKREIKRLLSDLHMEDCANILVFITHHTKDDWILDEIQMSLMELYDDQAEAKLDNSELTFLEDFVSKIPRLVMETREIASERMRRNKYLDSKNGEDQIQNVQNTNTSSDEVGQVERDFLARMNKVFKSMEIAGQIVRNRHDNLHRNTMSSLVEEGSAAGLRFLNFFITLSDTAKGEIIKYIEERIRDYPDLTDEQIQKGAQDFFYHSTFMAITYILKKIASSVGSKEAYEIYNELENKKPFSSIQLINRAIGMQFRKELNVAEISRTARGFSSNAVCLRILREQVIQHTYMFPIEYDEKQKVSEALDISVKMQNFMDIRKKAKG